MLRIVLLFIAIFLFQQGYTQVRATTESGNKVLLFDDGTWKYDEKRVEVLSSETIATVAIIDTTKQTQTEEVELFNALSPRLVRYFGEERSRIRCKISCSNTFGEIRIHFLWEIPVGDGQRYFGYLKSGSKLSFYLEDGQKVDLAVEEDSEFASKAKYHYSTISGNTQALNTEQLKVLTSQTVLKMEVEWKKKAESYDVDVPDYFIITLPTVY